MHARRVFGSNLRQLTALLHPPLRIVGIVVSSPNFKAKPLSLAQSTAPATFRVVHFDQISASFLRKVLLELVVLY